MDVIRQSYSFASLHRVRFARALLLLVTLLVLAALAPPVRGAFIVNNLVTDDPSAHAAQVTDTNLVNPWGVAYSPTSPFWVANNGTGTSTLYSVNPATDVVTIVPLVVTIPGAGNPTGMAFNAGSNFGGDRFLFVSEDGTVSGWRPPLGTTAETLETPNPDDLYKGAATGAVGAFTYLYTTNFHEGEVEAEKGDPAAPDLPGNFTDPGLPSGYAPFGIANLGDLLYVTYAFQDPADPDEELAGAGLGLVDVFDLNGNFISRFASNGPLNAPWGLAIAPASFGAFAGDLLVGNFGDGRINAYDLATHAFEGQLLDPLGAPITIDGLWALIPGNGGGAGSPTRIYFSAGPDEETHGLFGVIAAVPTVPEPATAWMVLLGMVPFAWIYRRRRR
jgi:uncharacterized protein (TIGR03118 family)